MLVLFVQSSLSVPPFILASLSPKSLYVSLPMLGIYIQDRRELDWRSSDLFSWITKGTLKIQQSTEYPLSKAGDAHRALEDRNRVGKLLLIP